MPTVHIIRNDEVGLSECGLLLDTPYDLTGVQTVSVSGKPDDIAIWDDVEIPETHLSCHACETSYNS